MVFARGCLVLGCLVACKFTPPAGTSDGGSDAPDGPADAPPDVSDAPDLCTTWDAQHFEPCTVGSPMPAPTLDLASSPYTYNTTTSGGTLTDRAGSVVTSSTVTVAQADNTVVALWNVASLTVPTGVVINVIGDKPLVIASWDLVALHGTIDAGSHTAEIDAEAGIDATVQLGAGASTATCASLAGTAGNEGVATSGSGGGGGGGFGGTGAAGSLGDTGSGDVGGGAGGMSVAATAIMRAGCPGGQSGIAGPGPVQPPATSFSFANAGAGGGAIVVAARTEIAIEATGRVLAGGGGGAGSPQGSSCGGGGGGSGGYVGLDAPSITVVNLGVVAANGGGGGGAAGVDDEGAQGADGEASDLRASGGAASPSTPVASAARRRRRPTAAAPAVRQTRRRTSAGRGWWRWHRARAGVGDAAHESGHGVAGSAAALSVCARTRAPSTATFASRARRLLGWSAFREENQQCPASNDSSLRASRSPTRRRSRRQTRNRPARLKALQPRRWRPVVRVGSPP